MFDFKEWLKKGIIDGYKQDFFSMPHVTTMTANYISSGMLVEDDAEYIAAACAEWDAEKALMDQAATLEEPAYIESGEIV